MKIAVVALGKIGLPLAAQFAKSGHEVVGVDINQKTVDLVNDGIAPFPGEFALQEVLTEVVNSGNLKATSSYADAIPNADAVVIVVPLFVNDQTWEPDFDWMDSATSELAKYLSEDTLISYETTLPVGTTRGRWKPMIERISGLEEGKNFNLVFSPERVLTGRVFADLRKYPKLVGALNSAGAEKAIEFYESVLQFDNRNDLPRANGVWDMGSAEAAEMAKLAETTYRDVNIGLANQFAVYADTLTIDIQKVIEACNSQPFSHIHRPGIAVGGHCIPVYPRLYLSTDPHASIVREARIFNATMPQYAVSKLSDLLGGLGNLRIAVLGASYRGGVKETAFSGVFGVVNAIRKEGGTALVADPFYTSEEIGSFGWEHYSLGKPIDAVIFQADHNEFALLSPDDFPGVKAILDGRNITDSSKWHGIPRLTIG